MLFWNHSDRSVAALRSAVAAVCLAAASLLVACGTERSAEAFCGELRSSSEKMRQNVANAGSGVSEQLAVVLANMGEFTSMLDRLNERAPDEIKADMQAAVDYWDEQKEALSQAASDPLGAILASVTSGLFSSASLRAVDTYSLEHCGLSVFGTETFVASGTPSATPSESVVAGANLDGRILGGRDEVASNGVHAVVVSKVWNDDPWRPQFYYETFDVATGAPVHAKSSPGINDGSCGFLLVRSGDRSLILDMITMLQPAQGIEKARIAESVRAIDASTMRVLWTTQIVEGTRDEVSGCNPAGWGLHSAFVTRNGSHLLLSSVVVDLKTGDARQIDGAWSAIGNWVAVDGDDGLLLIDPGTGETVGTLAGWSRFHHEDQDAFGAGLFVSRGEDALAGYALPSGTIAWRTTYDPISRYIRYDATANAFVFSDRAYGANEVLAVSAADGHTLWGPIDTSEVCGVDGGHVIVSVNGQIAVLDVSTGEQVSYDPATGACPTVLPGLLVRESSSGRAIQLLSSFVGRTGDQDADD